MMKTLELSVDSFDNLKTFKVAGVRGNVLLKSGYDKADDGILWGLQCASILKSHYTEEELAHGAKMRAMQPIEKGEIVMIEGKEYKARILGNYSNCVIFDPVNQPG